jgi:hypothetical protein
MGKASPRLTWGLVVASRTKRIVIPFRCMKNAGSFQVGNCVDSVFFFFVSSAD